MNVALRGPDFSDSVITESIRWIEQQGPLEDAEAMRTASAGTASPSIRIIERASVLGERLGLQAELARIGHWAPWVMVAIVALIVMAGLGAAGSVTDQGDRRINVMVALVSLLGLHLITLVFWLVGLLVSPGAVNVSLGGLWLALTARVAGGKQGQTPVLVRAATGLVSRARLLPWAFGFVSHTIWTLSFAVVLAALLFALAFRNYTLTWETTILEPAFFVRGVQLLGTVPSWLGFPVPDAQTVMSSNAPAAGQRAWALWLTGCVVVYGLLPRALLALLCAAMWKARKSAFLPDFSDPYYRKLTARFAALAPPVVIDADGGHPVPATPLRLLPGDTQDLLWVVGFELADDIDWPPSGLPAAPAEVFRVDGSAGQRSQLLDRLVCERPARLLLACQARSSPDRGTQRLLGEVQSRCGECRIWLMGADVSPARWTEWLRDVGLAAIRADVRLDTLVEGWT